MQIHAETLFLHDDAGRLRSVNTTLRPEEHPAPLVYFGRTVAGTVCRFRHDVPVALCEVLEEVGRRESFAPLEEDAGLVEEVRRRLEDAGWVIGSVYSGPAYVFAEEIELRQVESVDWLLVGEADAGVLRRYFGEVMPEVGAAQPFVAVIVDGDAVAVCRTVRRSKRGVEAGLESALEYRGRGFGTLAAALWAVETRRVGGLPMYSLRWDNVASRRVAARLGLVQYGVDFHWSAA